MDTKMTLEGRVLKAQKDTQELEKLIIEYTPFIKASISKTLKKYVHYNDDELTTGMLGFQEAVLTFDSSKGGFLSHAKIVIRNRLIDELRKENRQTKMQDLSLDDVGEHSNVVSIQDKVSYEDYENRKIEDQRKDDLIIYTKVLESWDMSMADLVASSPKKKKLMELYQQIAKFIADDKKLLSNLRETRRLPAAHILNEFVIDRKRLDRGRKYIIAVVELWAGDFESLQDYIKRR